MHVRRIAASQPANSLEWGILWRRPVSRARRTLRQVIHHSQLHGFNGQLLAAGPGQHDNRAREQIASLVQVADHLQPIEIELDSLHDPFQAFIQS